ncbi:MAG TPA: nitroreductase family protein [Stellaceae bacterium]|jgi:3-hydroxypropanoate dehydrogenase|nr:nitroreductase family protein [Stellaceae bacterium]
MRRIINDEALDTLFRAAACPHAWLARPVSDTLLRAVWELVKLGPTNGAGRPARILFIRSEDAKARLAPAVPAAHRETVMTAPVAAIVATARDSEPRPAEPHGDALEAAYLIVAARALGLDCAPVWELDGAIVDAAFFSDGTAGANFLCGLGYGDDTQLSPVERRPALDEACRIL